MTWLWNSYYISFIVATIGLGLTAMAAFAFSRFRFRGRRVGLMSLLAVQIFPQFLAFVAIFLLLDQIGEVFPAFGLDTHPGLILVYLGGSIGFNTFLIKGFMDSVPQSLDESAVVDGAPPTVIFWRIILPQCVKRMIPPWMNWYAILTMATPLCSILGVEEVVVADGRPALIIRPDNRADDPRARIWRVQLADFRISGNPKSGEGLRADHINDSYQLLVSEIVSGTYKAAGRSGGRAACNQD